MLGTGTLFGARLFRAQINVVSMDKEVVTGPFDSSLDQAICADFFKNLRVNL